MWIVINGVSLMPKQKKEIDDLDIGILYVLHHFGEATAYDISNVLNQARGTVSKRLKELVDQGILEEAEVDISTGKLRKIYKSPNVELIKDLLFRYYKNFGAEIDEEFFGEPSEISDDDINSYAEDMLDYWLSDDELLKLRNEGINILDLIREKTKRKDATALDIATLEFTGLIEVKDKVARLSEKGKNVMTEKLVNSIKEDLKLLKEISREDYNKLLSEICNNK